MHGNETINTGFTAFLISKKIIFAKAESLHNPPNLVVQLTSHPWGFRNCYNTVDRPEWTIKKPESYINVKVRKIIVKRLFCITLNQHLQVGTET